MKTMTKTTLPTAIRAGSRVLLMRDEATGKFVLPPGSYLAGVFRLGDYVGGTLISVGGGQVGESVFHVRNVLREELS